MTRPRERTRIWPAPIALGAVSALGLIAALLSDAAGDVLAWFALAAPVCIIAWFITRRSAT
jgi:hypothetical protein